MLFLPSHKSHCYKINNLYLMDLMPQRCRLMTGVALYVTVIAGVGIHTAALAQLDPDSVARAEPRVVAESRFIVTKAPDQTDLAQLVADFEPGAWTSLHTHGGQAINLVLEGEITLRHGGTNRLYKAGQSLTDRADQVHAAGNTGSGMARLLTNFEQIAMGRTPTLAIASCAPGRWFSSTSLQNSGRTCPSFRMKSTPNGFTDLAGSQSGVQDRTRRSSFWVTLISTASRRVTRWSCREISASGGHPSGVWEIGASCCPFPVQDRGDWRNG